MSNRAALSGSLTDLPLGDLLALLSGPTHSGVVELAGAAGGLIVIEKGAVTLALADDGPTLAQVAIGSGLATPEMWEHAYATALKGRSLAAALIDEGVDPATLESVLRDHVVGALFEFLLPSDTSFAFLPGATHMIGTRYRFEAQALVADAARRVEVWKTVAESIPSTAMVVQLSRSLPGDSITISTEDWRVLSLVDGRTSVADIVRSLGVSAFTVCEVLHRLLQSGCIEAAV